LFYGECGAALIPIMIYIAIQIETSLLNHFLELVDESDKDKNGKIDFGEWEDMGEDSLLSYCWAFF
jgi:hypothetical protein